MSNVTGLYQCPDCSKPVGFRSKDSNVVVCSCGSVLRLKDDGSLKVLSLQVIASPEDYIQIGTTGKWGKESFEVIGRCRFWTEEAVYNYWSILLNDGTVCYLCEAYGLYAFHEKILLDVEVKPSKIKQSAKDEKLQLTQADSYFPNERERVLKAEVEGEMLFPETDNQVRLYDYSSYSGKHLQFIEWITDLLYAYKVSYTSTGELSLTNTNNEPLKGMVSNCPGCKREITIKTYPYAQSGSCSNCGARFFLRDLLNLGSSGKDIADKNQMDIPLGATGVLHNIKYEVVGFALKEELNAYHARWKEYVLYNKSEGYAFLSEYNGHWIYLREQGDTPVLKKFDTRKFTYDQEPFELFNKYEYKTIDTAGEFPYNVFNDGKVVVYEYISPPEMWSAEKNNKEGVTWFYGQHVDGKKLREQFPYPLPWRNGVGALQPGYINPAKIIVTGVVALLVMIGIHLAIGFAGRNSVLLDKTYILPDSAATTSFVTDKFELTKWKSNLQLDVSAPVSNSWFELNANLVNAKTGEEFSVSKGVEYYYGVSDGESWSEGSTSGSVTLSSLPAGSYFLQLQGSKEQLTTVNSFSVKATADTPNHKNLYYFMLILILWPVIQAFRVINNEKRRWESSPYSPYSYEEN